MPPSLQVAPLRLLALGFFAASALQAGAQMHHVDAPEKVTRAVGVYEWTGELGKPTASRFVPVSLFIDGRFEDAGLYLARPVPFALQSGDLYTVERSGEPTGTFDLDLAERIVSGAALADDNPTGAWYGFGRFTAQAAPKQAPPLHRSAHVGVIQTTSGTGTTPAAAADADDGRPHMARRGSGTTDGGSADSSPTTAQSTRDSGTGSDDTDRPTLARRDPSQDASRRRAVGGKGGTASVTALGPGPGDDPDRPTLSHKTADTSGPKELTGLPADLHQAVAVSDAANRDPHPFARPWEGPADRETTLTSLQALARPAVLAYLKANQMAPSNATAAPTASDSKEGTAAATESGAGAPPKLERGRPAEYGGRAPAPAAAAARVPRAARAPARTATAQAPLTLREEQISGFQLSYGGLPTFAYTASAGAALQNPGDAPPAKALPTVFVTVVAQRLPSGELQVALSAVTDSTHLDRAPRLRLIDAVDPDASHRASLLFELRGSSSRQFALYRLTSARAENTFTSASIE